MAITIVSRTTGDITSDTESHSISLPSSILAADSLLVVLSQEESNPAAPTTESSGWVQAASTAQGTSTNVRGSVWYCADSEAGGSPLTVTMPTGEPQRSTYVVYHLRGAGDTISVAFQDDSSSTIATIPALTGLASDDYLSILAICIDANPAAYTAPVAPSGYYTGSDNRIIPPGNGSASTFCMDQQLTGATGVSSFDISMSANDQYVSFSIAVPPAAASTETHHFYLANQAADYIPGGASSFLNDNGEALNARHLSATPLGTPDSTTLTETSSDTTWWMLLGQWISYPATAAGTLDVAHEAAIAFSESSTDADMNPTLTVWVTQGDTTSARGVAVNRSYNFLEFGPTATGIHLSPTGAVGSEAPVDFEIGDRIVVEVIARATTAATTAYDATVYFGGTSGTDLTDADTNMAHPGWIDLEITPGVTFEVPPEVPGEVFDLTNWKITLPTDGADGGTTADEVEQPALDSYIDENFYVDGVTDRMVMLAPVQGVTTSGSGGTRTELREMEDGDEAAWTPFDTDFVRQLTVTMRVDPTSITDRQEQIIGQIHGTSGSPPVYLSAQWESDATTPVTPRVRVFKDGPGVDPNLLSGALDVGVDFSYRIRYDPGTGGSEGGTVSVYVAAGDHTNLSSTPDFTWTGDEFTDNSGWYFKVGSYNKSEVVDGGTGTAVTEISYLELIQDGDPAADDITGTGSASLGALVAAAAGAPEVAGSAAASLGALTSTGTGTRVVAGTVSATLGTLSGTATGDVEPPAVDGVAFAGQGPDPDEFPADDQYPSGDEYPGDGLPLGLGGLAASAAGTSSVLVTGTASAPLGALAGTSSGIRTAGGTAAASLGGLSSSATGVLTTDGSATTSLGVLSSSATGARTVPGSGASTLGALTVIAAGVPVEDGAGASTLGGLSAGATGSVTVNGSATALGALAASATGTRSTDGTASTPLGTLSASVSGVRRTTGSAVAPLSALVATASGLPQIVAAALASLGGVSGTASGTRLSAGTAVSALGSLHAAVTGEGTTSGAGSAPFGALSASGTGHRTTYATGVASLGLTATVTGEVAVSATATAPLGALTATATGSVTGTGTAAGDLGGLAATSAGHRTTYATATAPLGELAAEGAAIPEGTGSAPLGGLAAIATGIQGRTGVASADLGGLSADAPGVRTAPGSAVGSLGGLSGSGTGSVRVFAVIDAPLGGLTDSAVGTSRTAGTATAVLGTLVAIANGDGIAHIDGAATAVLGGLLGRANGVGFRPHVVPHAAAPVLAGGVSAGQPQVVPRASADVPVVVELVAAGQPEQI